MTGEDRTTPRPWKVYPDARPGIDQVDPLGRNVIYAARFTGVFGGVGTDADAALIVTAVNQYDRLRAIEDAARWLVDIHAGSVSIQRGSVLWEDIDNLRAALEGAPHE